MTTLKQARNIGPVCAPELRRCGFQSLEELVAIGWEEAFLCYVEHFPKRLNVNAAVALIGAIEGIDWRAVSSVDKQRARKIVNELRQTKRFGSKVRQT